MECGFMCRPKWISFTPRRIDWPCEIDGLQLLTTWSATFQQSALTLSQSNPAGLRVRAFLPAHVLAVKSVPGSTTGARNAIKRVARRRSRRCS
jgi:hypothetical protein